jgi:LAGLIDADG endonuclease
MSTGDHLTKNGIQQIVNIKANMNLGISNLIKLEFSKIKPIQRPIINTTNIHDPQWISGFVSGDGNFDAGVRSSNNIIGYKVYLRFRITQHAKDSKLLELIIKYLGSGRLEKYNRGSVVNLVIGKFSDLNQIIIPFFNKYPLCGIKHYDYQDWCKITNLITEGKHLTNEGLEQIKQIKSGMNKGRTNL